MTVIDMLSILVVVLVAVGCFISISCMEMRHRHGAVWRPLVGLILRKQPMIPVGSISANRLFRAGNKGQSCETTPELLRSYRLLEGWVKRSSYFLRTDMATLNRFYQQEFVRIRTRDEAATKRKTGPKTPPPAKNKVEWRQVFGLPASGGICSIKQIEPLYRKLMMKHHPDRGGSHETAARINAAMDAARKELHS